MATYAAYQLLFRKYAVCYCRLRLSFIVCTAALSCLLRVRRAVDLQCGHQLLKA